MENLVRTIIFYSYKGGTGRSLLLANSARYLCSCGKKVFILDCDLEAPGLHHKLEQWIVEGMPQHGLVDYISEFMKEEGSKIPKNLSDFVCTVRFDENKVCHFMPAGNAPSPEYAHTVLGLDWKQLFPPLPDSPDDEPEEAHGVPFFRYLKERIEKEYKPDFLLIDSRTGITDIGSVVTKFLADTFVCVFLMNPENIEGTKAVLKSVGQMQTSQPSAEALRLIPILSRVPEVPHAHEANRIDKVRTDLGDAIGNLPLYVLHDEPDLQVLEELRFGSDNALCQSVLLRDYLNVFNALDEETVQQSPYFGLRKYLDKLEASASDARINNMQSSIQVLDNIDKREEKELRHAGKCYGEEYQNVGYGYVPGDQYIKLISKIVKCLLNILRDEISDISCKEKPVPENNINWDSLGFQMQSQKFDFCSEPYYLTRYRMLFAGVVQFGWIETFTCFVKRNSLNFEEIDRCGDTSFEGKMRLVNKECPNLAVGMMGESAGTDEASKIISPFIAGTSLVILRDATALWDWIKQDSDNRIVVCDHTVAKKMHLLANPPSASNRQNDEYVFAENHRSQNTQLLFRFSQPIPAGFLYPIGDWKWRYLINQAFAEAVTQDLWSRVEEDLKASGIVPFPWDELVTQIVLGKNPEDGYRWLKETKA